MGFQALRCNGLGLKFGDLGFEAECLGFKVLDFWLQVEGSGLREKQYLIRETLIRSVVRSILWASCSN